MSALTSRCRPSPRRPCLAVTALGMLLALSGPAPRVDASTPAPSGNWTRVGDLKAARARHTATLLLDGRVLVAGGTNYGECAELYDPDSQVWRKTGCLDVPDARNTATLLPSGRVLLVGRNVSQPLVELFDPITGTWGSAKNTIVAHVDHTATRLRDGRVLVAGGDGNAATAEIYDAPTGKWHTTADLITGRSRHSATLLPDRRILVVGGHRAGGANELLASTEIYDPGSGRWTAARSMTAARSAHTATLLRDGRVLVVGGAGGEGVNDDSAEVYDPVFDIWRPTASMAHPRSHFTATLLPNGRVLVAGGDCYDDWHHSGSLESAELYDPGTGSWRPAEAMNLCRERHTATLLQDGTVLIAGGELDSYSSAGLTEVYDPNAPSRRGSWHRTVGMREARQGHTATLLPCGLVLVAGGHPAGGAPESAKLYDPATDSWLATGSMATPRYQHLAVLLKDGRVLVVGGDGSPPSAELFDPAIGRWRAIASPMSTYEMIFSSATGLDNGRVLLVGESTTAELYDPGTESWRPTGPLHAGRRIHTATLLADGRVLVAGDTEEEGLGAEIYDPATETWAATKPMLSPGWTWGRTATLLLDGRVLFAGGTNSEADRSSGGAGLYDPQSDSWTGTGAMIYPRNFHTATLLPNGSVLVAGGADSDAVWSSELYDPITGRWNFAGPIGTDLAYDSATTLPGGDVLVTRQSHWASPEDNALIYSPAPAPAPARPSASRLFLPLVHHVSPERWRCGGIAGHPR